MDKPLTGQPPVHSAAMQGAVQPRFGEVRIRQRGRLPHWEKDSGLYFVTFRLADSIPREVLKKMIERTAFCTKQIMQGRIFYPASR
jgi:hypothetical protein